MNKKDLISRTVKVLCDNNVRKPISVQKTTLHVTDDNGNKSDFIIKKKDTNILFTIADVSSIIDAILAVVEDALKNGEEISLHGFGTLFLNKRSEKLIRHPTTNELMTIAEHYTPKFLPGNQLKIAAKVYEMSLDERKNGED